MPLLSRLALKKPSHVSTVAAALRAALLRSCHQAQRVQQARRRRAYAEYWLPGPDDATSGAGRLCSCCSQAMLEARDPARSRPVFWKCASACQ